MSSRAARHLCGVLLVGLAAAGWLGCDDPLPATYDGHDVSITVEPVNEDTFNIAFRNPNHVRVGVQFRLRIYRWSGQEPETSLENVYVGPGNTDYFTVRTGGCGEPPPPATARVQDGSGAGTGQGTGSASAPPAPPECNLRVTATLLQQYVMAQE